MILADKNFILACYQYLAQMDSEAIGLLKNKIANGIFNDILQKFPATTSVYIFCGNSFKGSIGFVLSQILSEHYSDTRTILFQNEEQYLPEDVKLIHSLREKKLLFTYTEFRDCCFEDNSLIIDAIEDCTKIFSNIEDKRKIKHINQLQAYTYSIDMPSGIAIDEPIAKRSIYANFTHCLLLPRKAFFLPESESRCGQWEIFTHDIVLPEELAAQVSTMKFYTTSPENLARLSVTPPKYIHKYSLGHGLLIAGSYGMGGAAVLAARAATRAGLGTLTLHIPKLLYNIMQISIPEARCWVDTHAAICSSLETNNLDKYTAIAIGPGLGTHQLTEQTFAYLLQNYNDKPIVFDADAINMLALNKDLLKDFNGKAIFTPHEGEFKRLIGKFKNDMERLQLQLMFSQQYNAIVVFKGAFTCISLPDGRCYFNTNGNIGMATGGSGDVLTGIILALLCQGFSPEEAAICGVYMHAEAADIAVKSQTKASLTASDIVENLKFVKRYE